MKKTGLTIKLKRETLPFIYSVAFVATLTLGLVSGWRIAAGHYERKAMVVGGDIIKMQDELALAKKEVAFWQQTLKRIVEGEQPGMVTTGRPSDDD